MKLTYRSLFLLISMTLVSQLFATVIYVKPTGDDTNNGLSWATAKQTVSAGIAAAISGDQLWVAAGTYIEHLTLNANVSLYGGFNGTETQLNQRNIRTNLTVLDANKNGSVFKIPAAISNSTTISGFTIKNSFPDNGSVNYLAINNQGSPIIANNVFISNYGAIGTTVGSPFIINNVFAGNKALTISGGNPTITNCTFTSNNNTAIYISSGSCTFTNNIVAFNDGGIRKDNGASLQLKNNCVFGNNAFNYSGLAQGTTDIVQDPQIASVKFGDPHILSTSPCVNAGDNSSVTSGQIDYDGQSRIQGITVDIGADESDGSTPQVIYSIIHVSPTGDDNNDGSTWLLAKKTIQAGINQAFLRGGEVWVKKGIYSEEIQLALFVQLYGGFIGNEALRDQRNWSLNKTILEGLPNGTTMVKGFNDIGYLASTLDGFTCRHDSGNYGSCIYLSSGSPYLLNNTIVNNKKSGIAAGGSSFIAVNNLIIGNGYIGLAFGGGNPLIINNTIVNNGNSGLRGTLGTRYDIDYPQYVTNNIIAYNGAGITLPSTSYLAGNTFLLSHNCVFGNQAYNYYRIDPGTTDITINPQLASMYFNNYHPMPTSPCINAGLNSAVASLTDTDAEGQPRILGNTVDIGAYESNGSTPQVNYFVIRVSPTGDDNNNGSSWPLAKYTVQAAIDALGNLSGEIWVKSGSYFENITLSSYVQIYGGFNGTEIQRDQRNWNNNVTVLDGNASNSSVVRADGKVGFGTSMINGFTIQNGSSSKGGGISLDYASPLIFNNKIINNTSLIEGGGIYGYASSLLAANNVIMNNSVYQGDASGGIYATGSYPKIVNNTIINNTGGVNLYYASSQLVNNIIAFNFVEFYISGGDYIIDNNCIYGNVERNYTFYPPGSGYYIPNVDPQLSNIYSYHVLPTSPCINGGDTSYFPSFLTTDIDGKPRVIGGTIDIGASENDGTSDPFVLLTTTVKLQGYRGTVSPLTSRTIYVQANNNYYSSLRLIGSGDTGTFSLRLPPNSSNSLILMIKRYLSQRLPITVSTSSANLSFLGQTGRGMIPGDYNFDNVIDESDLTFLINNFLQGASQEDDDANGDGVYNDTDLLAIINNFLMTGDN